MKTCCDHCGLPRSNGHTVRLPHELGMFTVCTACHLRLIASYPTHHELTDMLIATHNLRASTP